LDGRFRAGRWLGARQAPPGLITQNDIGSRDSPVLIVAAISSGEGSRYDIEVEVKAPEGGLRRNSLVLLNQIRTVDKQRLGEFWGRLSPEAVCRVDRPIEISLGLVPV
jgi:mRNA interferase MazF